MKRDEIRTKIKCTYYRKTKEGSILYLGDVVSDNCLEKMIDCIKEIVNSELRRVLEELKETIIFRVECLGKNECDSVMFAIDDIKEKLDKELEGVK